MTITGQWSVLIIDDEADIREVTALTLQDAGYRVETAVDGIDGLARCESFHPQIVITDIRMPRMDGLRFLETVKARFPDTEVIVATAFGEMETAIRALQLDASDFITKPIHADALMVALSRASRRFTTRQQLKEHALRRIHRLQQEMADQARLLHQDKMMSLGRLAASVAHEINNPLAGILNYIRLMLRTLQKGPLPAGKQTQFVDYLSLVETETDRCAKIVSSLLTFSRKSPITTGPVAMADVIARSIVLARHRLELAKITLHPHIAEALPAIQGDANQLQQCLLNLIFNAVDAMPAGGTLTLEADVDPTADTLTLTVQDTGHGIPSEAMGHIFEPFFSTKPEGSGLGLGLSTTYGIIERHGGTLSVKSAPGQGTTFTIRLPLAVTDVNGPGAPA